MTKKTKLEMDSWLAMPHFRIKYYNALTEKIETREVAVWGIVQVSPREGGLWELCPEEILEWQLVYAPKIESTPEPIASYAKRR